MAWTREVRERMARRWEATPGAPMHVHLTTCQTEDGARRAGKRSGLPFRLHQLADGRWQVWTVDRGR